jgi:TolA-binding protein
MSHSSAITTGRCGKQARLEDRLGQSREKLEQVRQELKAKKQELNQAQREIRRAIQVQKDIRASLTFRAGRLVMRVPVWVYWKAVHLKQALARVRRGGGSDETR